MRRPVLQRGRVAALLIAGACLFAGGVQLPFPSPYRERTPRPVRLPFQGEWQVRFGGSEPYWNPLRLLPERCFGYEFWSPGPDGVAGPRTSVGAPVFAPAEGEVVRVEPLPEDAGVPERSRVVVVIAPAEGGYLHLGGLDPASLVVGEGSRVALGGPIGRVGEPPSAAGAATLRLHLSDAPEPGLGLGLPLAFHDVFVEGQRRERVAPAGGFAGRRGAGGWHVQNAAVR